MLIQFQLWILVSYHGLSIDQMFCLPFFIGGSLFWHICFQIVRNHFHILQKLGSKVCHFSVLSSFSFDTPRTNLFYWWMPQSCSELLDPTFLFASENAEKYAVQPMRLNMLLKMTRVKVSGLHYKKDQKKVSDCLL